MTQKLEALVSCKDPVLKTVIPKFNFTEPEVDPIEFAHKLSQWMLAFEGVGLSANQMGYPYRVFAIKANPILVCYNPRIVAYSDEKAYLDEGCLSYPGLYCSIRRSTGIRVRYTQPNGETLTKDFDGLTARIFQHEMGHMEGLTLKDYATRIHLDRAIKNAKLDGLHYDRSML